MVESKYEKNYQNYRNFISGGKKLVIQSRANFLNF
jgi:hypothetical protein